MLVAIALMLVRPWGVREAVPVCVAATLLVLIRSLAPERAWGAIAGGLDVYLFLAGMMLLAEVARRRGLFEYLAARAVRAANGSASRLFAIVYGVGVIVTVFFSNDATAVVLTPAVAVAVARARIAPLPYLFACAFVANAASFVLPISNPANLVIYGARLPPLLAWVVPFALPSLAAIAITFVALRIVARKDLRAELSARDAVPVLDAAQRRTAIALALAAVVLVVASFSGWPIGIVTLACGLGALAVSAIGDGKLALEMVRGVDVPVLALVAGLFVLVAGLVESGALHSADRLFDALTQLPSALANVGAATSVGLASNVANNLPVGLATRAAVGPLVGHESFVRASLIGVDLGPNLSVTGSLATILWLNALRRAGIEMNALHFLKIGVLVTPPALVAAALLVR